MLKCIYSLKENVESNQEHIIPAFLGGKKCLPLGWVSKEANDKFSKIEAECSLYLMFSLMREFVGPGKRGGNSVPSHKRYQIFEKDGDYSIGYIFNGKPTLITDVSIDIDNNNITFESDKKDAENIKNNYLKIKEFFNDANDKYITLSNDRIPRNIVVLGIDNKKKVIAINNEVSFNSIKPKLVKMMNNMEIIDFNKFRECNNQINATSNQNINLNILYRFYAKVVFNVAAKINGYAAILNAQFDTIRNAIYTGENINKYIYTCDKTFPLNNSFEKLEGITFDEKTCHLVHLFIQGNAYYGAINVYGGKNQYAIKLIENIKNDFYPKTDLYVCDWKNGFEGSSIDIAIKYCSICDRKSD